MFMWILLDVIMSCLNSAGEGRTGPRQGGSAFGNHPGLARVASSSSGEDMAERVGNWSQYGAPSDHAHSQMPRT